MDKKCNELDCRRNKVGGQAVIEGVMMKKGDDISLAVRKGDGTIAIKNSKFVSIKKKYKIFNIPILRGIVGFIESLILSFKTLNNSMDALGFEEEEGKVEKWLKKHIGLALTDIIMIFALILGVALALFLFTFLPTFVTKTIFDSDDEFRYLKALIEGFLKIGIFIAYILLVSLMKDIRRVFKYHGAEHKSIACYESGMELTPENAKKCTRFHPRCGTSFIFVMLIIGVFVGMFIPFWDKPVLRALLKILVLPLIVGLGYEFIMYAGKHDNILTKILSAPGLWMQRITTKEPDEKQLAIAICAIKSAMPEEFPDFTPDEYFISEEENKDHIAFTGQKKDAEKAEEETNETEEKEENDSTDDSSKS